MKEANLYSPKASIYMKDTNPGNLSLKNLQLALSIRQTMKSVSVQQICQCH